MDFLTFMIGWLVLVVWPIAGLIAYIYSESFHWWYFPPFLYPIYFLGRLLLFLLPQTENGIGLLAIADAIRENTFRQR